MFYRLLNVGKVGHSLKATPHYHFPHFITDQSLQMLECIHPDLISKSYIRDRDRQIDRQTEAERDTQKETHREKPKPILSLGSLFI